MAQDTVMSRAVSTAQTSLVDLTADALGAVFRWLASSDLASMPYVCRHLRDAMIVTGKIYNTLGLDLSKAAEVDDTDPVASMLHLDLSLWLARRGPFATALQIHTPDLGQESHASDAVCEALRSCRVERLTSLGLQSSGRLWKLPEILRSLHQLRQLSISAESTLETLPDWLHELHSLEEFSFECPIQCGGVSASRVVPKAMAPMPGVTRLTLKRLEVLEIAALLDKFCALQALKLHQVAAMIDRRPPAAASLQHLRSVEMSSCHLHSIPQVLMGSQLEELDLSNNLITIIPTWLARQQRLRRLVLHGNNIKFLPRTLARCQKLTYLDLSHNTQLQLHVYLAPGSYSSGRLPDAVTLVQMIVSLKELVHLDLRQPPEKFWSEQCHQVLAKARHAATTGLACNPALLLYT